MAKDYPTVENTSWADMRLAAIAMLVFLGVGCDPGWHYRVVGGTDGARVDIAGAPSIALRAYGSVFTSHLSFVLDVTNQGSGTLTISPSALVIRDADGATIPVYALYGKPRIYGLDGGDSLPVSQGQSGRLFADFVCGTRSCGTLTVDFGGITRSDAPVPIRFKLERI